MGRIREQLKRLVEDPDVIKELRALYTHGKIQTAQLVKMLHEGKITITEYVKIIKDDDNRK